MEGDEFVLEFLERGLLGFYSPSPGRETSQPATPSSSWSWDGESSEVGMTAVCNTMAPRVTRVSLPPIVFDAIELPLHLRPGNASWRLLPSVA